MLIARKGNCGYAASLGLKKRERSDRNIVTELRKNDTMYPVVD
jgi:hypothetical protein